MARISSARARFVRSSQAIRWVRTRVLPEPAPARMSSGPSPCVTAARCGGVRPPRSWSKRGAGGGNGGEQKGGRGGGGGGEGAGAKEAQRGGGEGDLGLGRAPGGEGVVERE